DERGVRARGIPQGGHLGVGGVHLGQRGPLLLDQVGGPLRHAEEVAHLLDVVEDVVEGQRVGLVGGLQAGGRTHVGVDAQICQFTTCAGAVGGEVRLPAGE